MSSNDSYALIVLDFDAWMRIGFNVRIHSLGTLPPLYFSFQTGFRLFRKASTPS